MSELGHLQVALERVGHRLSPDMLASFAGHADARVRAVYVSTLEYFLPSDVKAIAKRLLQNDVEQHPDEVFKVAVPVLGAQATFDAIKADEHLVLRLIETILYSSNKGALKLLGDLQRDQRDNVADAAECALEESNLYNKLNEI